MGQSGHWQRSAKNWDAGAVDIPGLTIGFPAGVTGNSAVTLTPVDKCK
jgi:hypothetical protein